MQSVPTTILSSETGLGKTPLLIVSQNIADGDYLSLLISNHLRPNANDSYYDRPLTLANNYFTNESVHRCTTELLKSHKVQNDLYTKLRLLLDEGFDTNKLFGLLLPIQTFCSKEVKQHFENVKCIFIYNDLELLEGQKSHNFYEVLEFIKTNSNNCFVVHTKFLTSNPEFVLAQLSSFISSTLRNIQTILPHTTLALSLFKSGNPRILPSDICDSFFDLDTIANKYHWFTGNNLLFIAYNLSTSKKDILLQKMKELFACFSYMPTCILLCEDDDTVNYYHLLLNEYEVFAQSTTCINQQNSLSQQLNDILSQQEKPYYFVDDLTTNFSYAQCLHKETSPEKSMLAFSKVSSEISNWQAGLAEVLLKDYPESNLFFSRQAWIELNQFDTRLNDHYVLWDFAIQVLEKYHHHAFVYPATFYTETVISATPEFDQKESIAYQAVLIKHRPSLETCLDEIIKIASHENLISHKVKIGLYEKIATQQIISSHAKEELKSLQLLTSQLHLRIQYLENNWYQKFRSKVSRFKKIFFKKKSPGTGSLKRILQFIRFSFSKAGFGILRKVVANVFKHLYLLAEKRDVEIVLKGATNNKDIFTYHDWIQKKLNPISLQEEYESTETTYTYKPTISIIMPVYNAPIKYLKAAIESVIKQLYPNWELCIADDCSTDKKIRKLLHVYSVKDPRIKVHYRTQNGHISATSNDALALATGAYILLMDHDDLLTPNCLWEVVKTLNEKPQTEIIYSDEDKIDEQSYHRDAHFKPDWAPDHLLSRNYIGHVCVLKKTLIDSIGGFRLGFEGSQDYDLMLRATEQTQNISHIPKVLYHWRIHQLSAAQSEEVKPYAYIAAKKALEEALTRRGLKGNVKYLSGLRGYKIEYDLQRNELVSIIIPTKDQTALLKNTIDSILNITGYQNFEIIVLNNNSSSNEFYDWCNEYTKKYSDRLRVIEAHFPFNFSKLMNMGANLANGDHLLMLNNDVEIIHSDWLEIMLSYAQQHRMGAVGAKLLYPDDTIQHAGVIIGLGGIAGHSFVGAYKEDAGYFNYIQSVNNYSAVTAACLLCRKEVFQEVGGMDETFEVEYNDVDFCLKLLEAGYNNVYLPQVELYHYESATRGHPHQSKPSYERHLKEMKLFTNKWQHIIEHDPFYNPNLNLGAHDFSMNFSA